MLAGAAAARKRPALSLLRLGRGVGIREQLWLEEALLRHDKRNWWVVEGWGGSMGVDWGPDRSIVHCFVRIVHLVDSPSTSNPPPVLLKSTRCILKDGEAPGARPTIVLGIGGKADKLVHLDRTARDGVPLLRRFSGGGTVIVDEDSLFVTFIMNTVRAASVVMGDDDGYAR